MKALKLLNGLIYKALPHFWLEIIARYFRVEVEGLENLPTRGPAILVPNHSGYLGLDALILSHMIYKARGRVPRILLHKLWFSKGVLQTHARKFGFLKASYKNGLSALKKKQFLIVFPEGEEGNFKPTSERYRLQDFKTGFVRMAGTSCAPVIPILITGAEEAHVNLGQLRILDRLFPIPFNVFPLPAKWKVKILQPIHMLSSSASETQQLRESEMAAQLRDQMQRALDHELSLRKYIFLSSTHNQTGEAELPIATVPLSTEGQNVWEKSERSTERQRPDRHHTTFDCPVPVDGDSTTDPHQIALM
jgi:1-acyl-sn-glycerol-3-phosphate acyltransferase